MIFALDLEGVLAPEIWPVLGAHFGVPEFSLTTRDTADFDDLMRVVSENSGTPKWAPRSGQISGASTPSRSSAKIIGR